MKTNNVTERGIQVCQSTVRWMILLAGIAGL